MTATLSPLPRWERKTTSAPSPLRQFRTSPRWLANTRSSAYAGLQEVVLLAYVNDQWIVANEEEATVSFLAECVAPDAPDNTTVAGLLKDVTVTCDEHNSKTYDIDKSTITVDKASLGYDGNNEAFAVEASVAAENLR